MDEEYVSIEQVQAWEDNGLCVNCVHTWECHRFVKGCPQPDEPMLHTCPANAPDSAEMYDRRVMGPIRRMIREFVVSRREKQASQPGEDA